MKAVFDERPAVEIPDSLWRGKYTELREGDRLEHIKADIRAFVLKQCDDERKSMPYALFPSDDDVLRYLLENDKGSYLEMNGFSTPEELKKPHPARITSDVFKDYRYQRLADALYNEAPADGSEFSQPPLSPNYLADCVLANIAPIDEEWWKALNAITRISLPYSVYSEIGLDILYAKYGIQPNEIPEYKADDDCLRLLDIRKVFDCPNMTQEDAEKIWEILNDYAAEREIKPAFEKPKPVKAGKDMEL